MRNLKRVLSLALASIMLLGMMVIGASAADKTAADLTDIDKVTNKDAVNLMVDLGIITGKPDGSYAPTEGVDRATMAKLITYIMMGDVDQTAFQGTATDLKDIDKSWAEGYIKYCYSNGIITGDGKGSFFPTKGVTVVEASKMLLVALGYDSKAQGYVSNANWSTNITKDAQKAGLLEDLGLKANDTLTRDAAAKMIFNALFANTVSNTYGYDLNGNKYVSGSTANKTTLGEETYNLVAVKGIVTGISANGKAVVDGVVTELTAAPDQVGANVVYYKNGSTNKLISSTLSNGKSTVLGTSTDGTTLVDLSNADKSAYIAAKDTKVSYFLNGSTSSETKINDENAVGVIIDLIDNDNNGKYDVVRATKKTVATVGDKGVTISKATSTAKEDAVTIDGIADISKVAVSRVKGYADLVKGDVVLYVKIGNTFYIEVAESVTGSISGTKKIDASTTGYLLGGDAYISTGLLGKDKDAFADFNKNFNKDLTLYLDDNGSVVKLVFDTEAESTDYALVVETVWRDAVFQSGYGQAMLVFPDGTTEIATVSRVDGAKAVSEKVGDKYKIKGLTEGGFYNYKVDSNGDYVLALNTEKYKNDPIDKAELTSGVAKFDGTHVGNNATTFIVKNGDKFNVYTGIANVPATKDKATVSGYALVNQNSKIATYVYISNGENTTSGTTQSTVYFLDATSYGYVPESASGKSDDYYTFDAIVNGELETVNVAATNLTGKVANGLMAVKYDKSTNHIIEVSGSVDNTITASSNGKVSDGTIQVGSTYYTYTDDCSVYLINAKTRAASATTMGSVDEHKDATIVGVVKGGKGAASTTLKALYIEYTPSEGGASGGETATGFTVTDAKFANTEAGKVNFTADFKANSPVADEKGADIKLVLNYSAVLSNGQTVKMESVEKTITVAKGNDTASLAIDAEGVVGTIYTCEVVITYAGETTTASSDAVMITK